MTMAIGKVQEQQLKSIILDLILQINHILLDQILMEELNKDLIT